MSDEDDVEELVAAIAEIAQRTGRSVAAAESLTCGHLTSALGAGPEASEWLRGGVVAYAPEVKYDVLGVTPGPLVSERCARELARGVARLLAAGASVSATGVGGPGPDEGRPAGTVYVAAWTPDAERCQELALDGEPEDVIRGSVRAALQLLLDLLRTAPALERAPEG